MRVDRDIILATYRAFLFEDWTFLRDTAVWVERSNTRETHPSCTLELACTAYEYTLNNRRTYRSDPSI